MISGDERASIRQAFINHWNTVGRRRHGWIADPLHIDPVTRRHHERNHHRQTGKPQVAARVVPGALSAVGNSMSLNSKKGLVLLERNHFGRGPTIFSNLGSPLIHCKSGSSHAQAGSKPLPCAAFCKYSRARSKLLHIFSRQARLYQSSSGINWRALAMCSFETFLLISLLIEASVRKGLKSSGTISISFSNTAKASTFRSFLRNNSTSLL